MKPTKIEKHNGFPVIEVGLDEAVMMTDEQAVTALKKSSGMTTLEPDAIRGLANLGIYARGVGVLRKQRGEVMVNQAWLGETLKILMSRLQEEHGKNVRARQSVIRGIAHEIAAVSSVFRGWVDTSLELEKAAAPTGKPDDVERPRNTGFGTGTVIAAQEVHVHEAKKELPTNGDKA